MIPRKPDRVLRAEEDGDEGVVTEIDESENNEASDISNSGIQGDTSTAGIYGNVEGHMDTTQGLESHEPLPQRVSKRRKFEKDDSEKAMMQKDNEDLNSSIESRYSDHDTESNRKKKPSKSKLNQKDIIQKEVMDISEQMEDLRKDHSRQLKEQEQKNKENMESLIK